MTKSWFTPAEGDDPWFKPELRTQAYDKIGDAYDDKLYETLSEDWREDDPQPYLKYVREASADWPHLRLLADFMEVGTVPQRWKDIRPEEPKPKPEPVRVLDYDDTSEVKMKEIHSADRLRQSLRDGLSPGAAVKFRLYVVHDLSRDVIEALGQELNIDADFFRSHIVDYAWYNVRDRWRDPPVPELVGRRRNWLQMRYVTARYFDSSAEFEDATKEAQGFNVLRRPDDDLSNRAWWDKNGAIVAITRCRATYWLPPNHAQAGSSIGVLLLDPTVKHGKPLWGGRRNCRQTPTPRSFAERAPLAGESLKPNLFFDDFMHWATHTEAFLTPSTSNAHVPMQTLLHLACSEWQTMCDYIKTRLCQIDLEVVKPEKFATDRHSKHALEKLHMWRRFVPLYREMVDETLRHVFRFPCQPPPPMDTITVPAVPPASAPVSVGQQRTTTPPKGTKHHHPITAYEADFLTIRAALDEYQQRIDRLTAVVTAVMTIEDARRGLKDNHNIGRLTFLATFFIPFSLVAGIFSMQQDLGDALLGGMTLQRFFEV
ncbi:Uu.00g004830.m01.CDS01 [Anthostomella pinea]|uniref:Uu.00g004830.m01.CDS01 n=1 Tax=Anthostomella pinea TaxID=933095 RepID=A0AAI8VEP6_9PEZI|nr:Uu.00g004830.m01.CDS01 [Anthostomella pinea]